MSILKYHAHAKHRFTNVSRGMQNIKFMFRYKTQSASENSLMIKIISFSFYVTFIVVFKCLFDNKIYKVSVHIRDTHSILPIIASIIPFINHTPNELQLIRLVVNNKIIYTPFKNKL